MVKPNWDVFRAKFSGNTQNSFEWFCYLLFCNEFNRPFGIFRYKNQSAIETDPIEVEEEILGWQAKFYETALSSHKEELLSTIIKSKRDYPKISKLYIYTNQEWGQNKGQKPQGLLEIEQKAEELKILLEWRAASYFESEFVSSKNIQISKHFFTNEKSIVDLSDELHDHSCNILENITTYFHFNDRRIEIDRNDLLCKLKDDQQQISIVSGVGGVGKTVLIKNYFEQVHNDIPFYVFKATEFDLRHIDNLFHNFSFNEFVSAFKDNKSKVIVIDSSEKLLDLNSSNAFQEFLTSLIRDKWKIIFTTRDNYLENLNYHFFEIYNIAPLKLCVNELEIDELLTLSEKESFLLPDDAKLKELLRNPFYLNEFLKLYNGSTNLNYLEFKNKLWNKKIKINKPERERCFQKIAFERANSGQFFIIPDCPTNIIYDELLRDGILGYEGAGYFITHDIYEEWALEKIIESEFLKRENEKVFFDKIGQSLPVRRSFRNWLSEKLLLDDYDIKQFIESIIGNCEIDVFWKDEVMVSVLLSNYSKTFFELFAKELLADDQKLLKRISFILRLTCKEVDDVFLKQLGIKKTDLLTLKYVFTKPKGQGWEKLIEFVYSNIDVIGVQNIQFILPIIHDWNNKMRNGKTTKFSSLIALKFYKWIIEEEKYYSRDNTKENVFQTILYGSDEVKEELEEIFSEILKKGWKSHRDPYYDFSKYILTKIDGVHICKVLPEYIIKLADLFWTLTPKENFYHSRIKIEQHFGLEEHHSDYHPASALQTPVYWLLKFDFKRTIDFISNFTNKAIECYAKSGFDSTVAKVKVQIDQENIITQYVSHCLWNMYRGTSSPVSPYLLQSIHMALEKHLLEIAEHLKMEVLESWLKYLLMKSNSSSITSVVTSIVLANPDKTFNVAKILFTTKEFIIQDTSRSASEHSAKNLYSIGKNGVVDTNELFDDERIKTCDDKHRKMNLENLFLNYQLFRSKEISEEESQSRIRTLWNILDEYYKKIPDESEQNDQDRTWQIFLARMDKRKMEISTEETDEGLAIQFNPELDKNLREYSESSTKKIAKKMKYTSLKLWAQYKIEDNDEYKKYTKYENNPKLALKEVKEIIKKLQKIDAPKKFSFQLSDNEDFYLMNYSIPSIVCSLLIRDHRDKISQNNKDFCRDSILAVSLSALRPDYQYQVSDGVQSTISVLPILFEEYPEKRGYIKLILLLCLFNGEFSVGGMLSTEKFNIFSVISIRKLWGNSFKDAQSLLFAYLLLKPRYDELRDQIRIESYKSGNHRINEDSILERFRSENEENLQKMIDNNISFECLNNINEIHSSTLVVALKIIPNETNDQNHYKIVQNIVNSFSEKLLSKEKEDKMEYTDKHDFLKYYSYFLLNSTVDKIPNLLEPFLIGFNSSESIADLFNEIIRAEDVLDTYDNFWFIWNEFKEKMITLCENGDGYWYIDKIIKSYLFAQIHWKESAKDWHSFKENNKKFFKNISDELGHCPSTLYSLSKLLNNIGSNFLNEGIFWISNIILINDNYRHKKLESNTIYYIEKLIRKYIYLNNDKIKKTISLKNKIITILNFLTENGSVIGYMLRESIV